MFGQLGLTIADDGTPAIDPTQGGTGAVSLKADTIPGTVEGKAVPVRRQQSKNFSSSIELSGIVPYVLLGVGGLLVFKMLKR